MEVDDNRHCLQPLRSLLLDKVGSALSASALEEVDSLNFAGLRDKLLAEGALDVAWIKKASLLPLSARRAASVGARMSVRRAVINFFYVW